MPDKAEVPYGSWPSPITPSSITAGGVTMGGLSVDAAGRVHWLEGRPNEGGRYVLVRRGGSGSAEPGPSDVSPAGSNVRTRVHEYGGGAYCHALAGGIIFAEYTSQDVYLAKVGEEPLCLTPRATHPKGQFRFADFAPQKNGAEVLCVREDHGAAGDARPSEVVNVVVALSLDGSGRMRVLAAGRDFYAHPRPSPDGSRFAYVAWDLGAMPWDATRLWVAPFEGGATADTASHALVAGGDGDTSVLQPAWHPSGALYFVSDASGYYNIFRAGDAGDAELKPAVRAIAKDADMSGPKPGWQFGTQGFAFLADGRVASFYAGAASDGGDWGQLVVFPDSEDSAEAAAMAVEYGEADGLPRIFSDLVPDPQGSNLNFMGGCPSSPGGVYEWHVPPASAKRPPREDAVLLACCSSQRIDEAYISKPELVEFPTTLGTAFAYFYPPTNAECSCSTGAPPLLVKAHGGPTGAASPKFSPEVQYWTSRGFAVIDVDYGGSCGYGREYRRRLRGSWGVVDVDDVCNAARYCVKRGLADETRLAIDGGSAGGFTTLCALVFHEVFTAGCSMYGVADLATLAGETHKFESRYLDGLVGKYPQDREVFEERAPIRFLERMSCPVLFLHGDEDKMVPLNQAQLMHAALLAKGLPCALKVYEGEQHGFRKAENIEDALTSELSFYARIFGLEGAGAVSEAGARPFTIDNLGG